jgi:hypothetical protein
MSVRRDCPSKSRVYGHTKLHLEWRRGWSSRQAPQVNLTWPFKESVCQNLGLSSEDEGEARGILFALNGVRPMFRMDEVGAEEMAVAACRETIGE